METLLFYMIIAFVLVSYLFDCLLDALDATRWSRELPAELQGIYDEERYRKSQDYERVNTRFGILTSTLMLVIVLALLLVRGFGALDAWVRGLTSNPIGQALLFFGILIYARSILSIPLDLYHTFVIEARFGFNRTTPKTFVMDKIKGWILTAIIGGGLLSAFTGFYLIAGEGFWLAAWGLTTAFSVFMMMFYSTLIVPLFNKQTPLEPGELRLAIEEFARKAGFKLDNIFVIDGSRRSAKANAYFSGLGPKKRIVLFDTLIKDHTVEELVAVLAHEIGHYRKRHTAKGMLLSMGHAGVMLYLLGLFVNHPSLSLALGASEPSFHVGLLAFSLLYAPVSQLLGVVFNGLSRRFEYEADRFAAQHYDARALQEALKTLSVNHLSNLRPHPFTVVVRYSHPPLLHRLAALASFDKSKGQKEDISDAGSV